MLPRSKRLLPSRISGKLLITPFFSLRIRKRQDQGKKYGFIISKKIAKQAVTRNRIKRLLSTSVQELDDNILPGNDFLFFARKDAVLASKKQLGSELEGLLKAQKLYTL